MLQAKGGEETHEEGCQEDDQESGEKDREEALTERGHFDEFSFGQCSAWLLAWLGARRFLGGSSLPGRSDERDAYIR